MCQMPQVRSILVIICILSSLCAIVVQTQPMTKTSTDFRSRQISTSSLTLPETLPRDTFRLLAKALYQRDDKAANRLERKYFYNQSITCNDGSTAGYYIRRNIQSKRWIVFLEGT